MRSTASHSVSSSAPRSAPRSVPRSVLGPAPGPFFFGSKADLAIGAVISSDQVTDPTFGGGTAYLHFTTAVDGATWRAQLLPGEEPGRVYRVVPTGPFAAVAIGSRSGHAPWTAYPWHRTTEPVRVTAEILEWEPHPESRIEGLRDHLAGTSL